MNTIAVSNRKGGVAKTTTVYELAAAFHGQGLSVLCIDFDPQGSLTRLYMAQEYDITPAIDPNKQEAPKITPTKHGALIASSVKMQRIERDYSVTQGREYLLSSLLLRLEADGAKYDVCLIDTPPALGLHTMNALTAADALVIPVAPDTLTLPEAKKMIETAQIVKKYSNAELSTIALLLCGYEARRILSKEAEDAYRATAASAEVAFLESHIRRTSEIPKAQARRQSVFDYAPNGIAAADYKAAALEILNLLKEKRRQ